MFLATTVFAFTCPAGSLFNFESGEPGELKISAISEKTGMNISDAKCNLTIFYPNYSISVDNQPMENKGSGLYTYNVTHDEIGLYSALAKCQKNTYNGTLDVSFCVTEDLDNRELYIVVALGILALVFLLVSVKSEDRLGLQYLFLGLSMLMVLAIAGFMIYITDAATSGIVNGVYTAVSYGLILFFFLMIVKIIYGVYDAWKG